MNRILFIIFHSVSGVYAGACIAIALVDLRFVSSIIDPGEALSVFTGLLGKMGPLMGPQLLILSLAGVYFSLKALKAKAPAKRHLPTLIVVVLVLITILVHIPINIDLFNNQIRTENFALKFETWTEWHYLRTAVSLTLPWAIARHIRPVPSK